MTQFSPRGRSATGLGQVMRVVAPLRATFDQVPPLQYTPQQVQEIKNTLAQAQPGSVQYLNLCNILPTNWNSSFRQIIAQFGCHPAGQAAAAASLAMIPGAGPVISLFGTPFIIGCICQDPSMRNPPPPPPPRPAETLVKYGPFIGIAALGIGAYVYSTRKKQASQKSEKSESQPPAAKTKVATAS